MATLIDITEKQKEEYNKLVTHPLQAYEWGEFRERTGVKVVRKGIMSNKNLEEVFTITIHPIPRTPFTIGYLPKGNLPSKNLIQALKEIGKDHNCIFIQLEPNVVKDEKALKHIVSLPLKPSHRPLFTKYTFMLDLQKSEEDLLALMHAKTRYNVRLAARKGVAVSETNSDRAFKEYLALTNETTKRQKFYAHTPRYHTLQWETLPHKQKKNTLSSHLLTATFEKETLSAWILFVFHDTLYYPYGASSSKYKEKMASNLIMWEAIKFGKELGLKHFDMWGALGPEPDASDPWYGFHRFKQNYGATLTEFVGSYDLVLNPILYKLYQGADFLRWGVLRLKKQLAK